MKFPQLLEDVLKLPYYPSDEYIDMLTAVHTAAWQLECSGRTEESQYLLDFLEKDWEEWKDTYDYILQEEKIAGELVNLTRRELEQEVLRLRQVNESLIR